MKKFLSIVMVVILAASMCFTAFAAENTGSITVTNATKGQTYTVYQIFDASIKLGADGDAEAVSYSISPDSQFFSELFGADGKSENLYFNYDSATGAVTKKADAVNAQLISYLTDLVKNGNFEPVVAPKVAEGAEVKFEELPYGYYVLLSSLGAAVTINSNTPDVEVIDKNQEPGNDFEKKIKIGEEEDGTPIYADSNTANIGDVITYRIAFTATNYDGANKIKYYQIHDEKGEAIWVEFNDICVKVNGVELERGYYLSHGGINTDNWEWLGNWGDVEKDRDNAQWYLVHLGYDQFRITIPWLEGHQLVDVADSVTGETVSHALEFPEDAASKFPSPVSVEVTYSAAIEPNAEIGGGTNTNLFNTASGSWTCEHETNHTPPDTVITEVYGIGLLKDDAATGVNLAGAEFRVYKDEACTEPVYVIPTNIDGVYIVDSLNTPGAEVSGEHKDTARDLYAASLEEYLGEDYATSQDNLVVSQINGKLAILGLEANTYYLKEVKAPAGYNSLSAPIAITTGEGTKSFTIFADSEGNVADIQTTDGTHYENIYKLTSTVVHNSKGVELPSTGGQGTVMLITIGTLLAIGFAIFLITHKKMSVYKD